MTPVVESWWVLSPDTVDLQYLVGSGDPTMREIGFIGVGGRAQSHLNTVAASDIATVTAVCDVDETRVAAVATEYQATEYTDHEAMYAAEADLDAVFVCLPPFAHTDQETMAAERGIDLFVEKPLARTMEPARTILDAIEANDIIGAVGYQLRYADATTRAAELLGDRAVGLVEGEYKSGVPGGPEHWWQVYERSGGQVIEQATHIYDLLRLFGGEPSAVQAIGGHELVDKIDFEDVVSANITLEDGTVGHITSTSASPEHASGIEIIAADARLELSGNTLSGTVDGDPVDFEGENDATRTAGEAFLTAVDTGDPSTVRSTYADAFRTFALTLAVEESLQRDATVAV